MTDEENGVLLCIRFPTVFSFYVSILFFIISACTLRENYERQKKMVISSLQRSYKCILVTKISNKVNS